MANKSFIVQALGSPSPCGDIDPKDEKSFFFFSFEPFDQKLKRLFKD
jgi:hypothetical protein